MVVTVALPESVTFVTGNPGKVEEMQRLLAPHGVEVRQDDRGYPEIQADTLQEVAEAGAHHLLQTGLEPPFLLEDAGLFIAALNGFPGVYSRHTLDTIGCDGILRLMRDVELESRGAVFEAHLLYVDPEGGMHGFTGRCKGHIADRAAGDGGFGFDPVFMPQEEERTFAQLPGEEKNAISHRGRAGSAFLDWFLNQ